jgi:hypothetical protein
MSNYIIVCLVVVAIVFITTTIYFATKPPVCPLQIIPTCPTPEICPEHPPVKCIPQDGGWSNWKSVGTCSSQCGYGTITENRTCTNPVPLYSGANCVGAEKKSISCKLVDCPINGGWTSWTSPVSSECIYTVQESRTCTNPSPEYGGTSCVGNSTLPLITTPVPNCTTARYVTLSNSSNTMISLIGIQVFDQNGTNISDDKSVYPSSTYSGTISASKLTNAKNLSNGLADKKTSKYVIATSGADTPYITVDLGSVKNISKIIVYNRYDCCQANVNGMTVNLQNTLDNGKTYNIVWTSNAISSSSSPLNTFTLNLPSKTINYS